MTRTTRQRQKGQPRRPTAKRSNNTDLWRPTGPLPDVEPITPAHDPTALLRSLGQPPLASGNVALHHYMTVVERSATIAVALALSAGALTITSSDADPA